MSDKTIEYRLSKTQRRMVMALVRERDGLLAEANEANRAIDELAERLAQDGNLPVVGGRLIFHQGDDGQIVLRFVPDEPKVMAAPAASTPGIPTP